MNQTSLSYNTDTRQWELKGEIGELIAVFPPGAEGQRDALVEQLRIEAPRAIAVALEMEGKMPHLQGRAIRAVQLVATGAVLHGGRPARWRVRSQSSPRDLYTVHELTNASAGYRWHCSCQDWRNGEAGASNGAPWLSDGGIKSPTCKHILAVLFASRLPEPTWPPRCPACGLDMVVKRRQDDGSALPFWSCRNYPNCNGARDFQPHPDDLQAARGNGREALCRSLERAHDEGLYRISLTAQRNARERRLAAACVTAQQQRAKETEQELEAMTAQYLSLVNAGWDPDDAGAVLDAGALSEAEWLELHGPDGEER